MRGRQPQIASEPMGCHEIGVMSNQARNDSDFRVVRTLRGLSRIATRPVRPALLIAGLATMTSLSVAGCDDWPGVSKDSGVAGGGRRIADTSGAIGSSCGSSVTCNSGLICVTRAPDGLCSKSCSSDGDCQGGSCQLVTAWGGLLCLKTCVSDQMCREGYSCVSTGTANVCAQAVAQPDAGLSWDGS
jgi:hypothetical protein